MRFGGRLSDCPFRRLGGWQPLPKGPPLREVRQPGLHIHGGPAGGGPLCTACRCHCRGRGPHGLRAQWRAAELWGPRLPSLFPWPLGHQERHPVQASVRPGVHVPSETTGTHAAPPPASGTQLVFQEPATGVAAERASAGFCGKEVKLRAGRRKGESPCTGS